MRKDLRCLQRLARAQGWTIEVTGGGHLKWLPPNGGGAIYSASSPSDHWAIVKIRHDLRRAGLQVES